MAISVYQSFDDLTVSREQVVAGMEIVKATLMKRNPNEVEFHEAVCEVLQCLEPVFMEDPKYLMVFESLMEPERLIQFRVNWMDDKNQLHTNRGFRVQFNSALGPYKGGLRFHPTVSQSILKFLGFEQIFKNALTGISMGGGKGGSDFDPKGKSDTEVRNFCQAFMTELSRHIGPATDVPAGDIGVGGREIGFLFGQYRRMRNEFTGTLTGKGASWGGSLLRPEATGYGAVYFGQHMLESRGMSYKGQRCVISGSGNAAQYTAEKLIQLGAVVLTMSDSNGTLIFPQGMSKEDLAVVMDHKNNKRGRLSELENEKLNSPLMYSKKSVWDVLAQGNEVTEADMAFPAATQNEIKEGGAQGIIKRNIKMVIEVANMPCTPEAIRLFSKSSIDYAPGKAANSGGVAVSGMEMAQNAARQPWTSEKVDMELQNVMKTIYQECSEAAAKYGRKGDLQFGANVTAFFKVANAMIDQGLF